MYPVDSQVDAATATKTSQTDRGCFDWRRRGPRTTVPCRRPVSCARTPGMRIKLLRLGAKITAARRPRDPALWLRRSGKLRLRRANAIQTQPAAADDTPAAPLGRTRTAAQQPAPTKRMPQVHAHETRGAAAWTAATKSTSSEDHIKRSMAATSSRCEVLLAIREQGGNDDEAYVELLVHALKCR